MSRPGSGLPTLAAVLWLVGAYALTVALFGGMSRPRPAAVAVVLGTTARGDAPGAALTARLEAARRVHADGLVPVLFVSGASREGGYDESRVMRDWLVAHGVPDSAVVRDSLGATTRATARHAAAWLAGHGGGEALVVTHGFHVARAMLALRQAGVRSSGAAPADAGSRPDLGALARELVALPLYAAGYRDE